MPPDESNFMLIWSHRILESCLYRMESSGGPRDFGVNVRKRFDFAISLKRSIDARIHATLQLCNG
jgi:hypothetical protein